MDKDTEGSKKDEKKRQEKALQKLLETPEEKRKRRVEKKLKKLEKQQKYAEKEKTIFGYTNESNPFGDSNLTEKFQWKLKREKQVSLGLNPDQVSKEQEQLRYQELLREIDKVKKRREERELEKLRWEEERQRLARERDSEAYKDWEKKEAVFHLQQAKKRAEIRIIEDRPKPIDILAKNLDMDLRFDITTEEPYEIFKGLPLSEIESLKKDIKMHLELDSHIDFWQALMVVCDDELEKARKKEKEAKGQTMEDTLHRESGIHKNIEEDINDMFKGKSFAQLTKLQSEIISRINSGTAMDIEYWESVLKKLVVIKAKAQLKEIHAQLLRKRLELLQQQQAAEEKSTEDMTTIATSPPIFEESTPMEEDIKEDKIDDHERSATTTTTTTTSTSISMDYSPTLIHDYTNDDVVDPVKDMEELKQKRAVILQQSLKLQASAATKKPTEDSVVEEKQFASTASNRMQARLRMLETTPKHSHISTEDEMFKQEANKDMDENESPFNEELLLENQVYSWNDKYRPRKPRYFNRVHTGYEWNKYNQTHYDHDNPPPKVVQGYKFNLFYPDLVDKTTSPKYFIEKSDSPDTVILRFHAGPPYEDIAFKIVNKEWEYSHRKGFKCTFERGILHLYFNFKRYRYRR